MMRVCYSHWLVLSIPLGGEVCALPQKPSKPLSLIDLNQTQAYKIPVDERK
ncbi:hypothetical protein [Shewanella morhuae]|uniref:hypothetical protein n=1 Tax=Shewanella morhuae TaxID=365591 RepID=UPI0015E78895|nr:hypothetical protein [Shewanella morhuae]